MACSYCKSDGHNVTTCPTRLREELNQTKSEVNSQAGRIDALEGKVASLEDKYSWLEVTGGLGVAALVVTNQLLGNGPRVLAQYPVWSVGLIGGVMAAVAIFGIKRVAGFLSLMSNS